MLFSHPHLFMCRNMLDDEEEMLYGDSNPDANSSRDEANRGLWAGGFPGMEGGSGKAEPTHWCMMVRENGVMEVRLQGGRCPCAARVYDIKRC